MNIISKKSKISKLVDIESSIRGSNLNIEDGVTIDSFVKIKFAGGTGDINIMENVYINSGVTIYSGNGVSIGSGTLIAANTTIAATNHEYKSKAESIIKQRFMKSKGGVIIEEDCWIGSNCVILDGTHLGKGCVVGAGTIIKGIWENYSIIHGNPAKINGKRQ
jgi:virginiamycin A acetyltransferase